MKGMTNYLILAVVVVTFLTAGIATAAQHTVKVAKKGGADRSPADIEGMRI